MHLLAVVKKANYWRFVEGIAHEVIRRGGRVTAIIDGLEAANGSAGEPGMQFLPYRANEHWSGRLLARTRELKTYVHWLRQGVQAEGLLSRYRQKVPGILGHGVRAAASLGVDRAFSIHPFNWLLDRIEAGASPDDSLINQVRAVKADLALVTPIVYAHSSETDYQKACQSIGLKTIALVASWDNLSSKGTFLVKPDGVLVWNEAQVVEAARYHGLGPEVVRAVGAPVFDDAFQREWLMDRLNFCQSTGLDPSRPYVVYAVSSTIVWGNETEVVVNLRRALNQRPGGEQLQILVRPHPINQGNWDGFKLDGVHIWRTPAFPSNADAKTALYNTLYHAAVVTGLSTSIFLEAAILDRPGITLVLEDSKGLHLSDGTILRGSYTDFLHFQYLLEGGFLEIAENVSDCADRILALLAGHDDKQADRRNFVHRFLRPAGLDVPAQQVAVDLLEQWAALHLVH